MPSLSLRSVLVPSLVISGAVFAILTAPVARYGRQSLIIETQEARIFDGRVQDLAAPYIGASLLMAVATGVTTISVAGWRLAGRRGDRLQAEGEDTLKQLKATQAELEALKLSPAYLHGQGLHEFVTTGKLTQAALPAQAESLMAAAASQAIESAPQPAPPVAAPAPPLVIAQPPLVASPVAASPVAAPAVASPTEQVQPVLATQEALALPVREQAVSHLQERLALIESQLRGAALWSPARAQPANAMPMVHKIQSRLASIEAHLQANRPSAPTPPPTPETSSTLQELRQKLQALESMVTHQAL